MHARLPWVILSVLITVTATPVAGQLSHRLAPVRSVPPSGLAPTEVPGDTGLITDRVTRSLAARSHRTRNAVVGGLIGAATGVITCTVISNIVNDPNTGLSTCDTKAYLGFALGGAALGVLIGALIK